jgi:hypothetical protein
MEVVKVVQYFIKKYSKKIREKRLLLQFCSPDDGWLFKSLVEDLDSYKRKLKYWKKKESKLLIDLTKEDD